jgi:O-acetyl-ADP-ribose deacetylase (regulator of RNase III)
MINYIKGDVTDPVVPGIIAHVCNNRYAWGAGVVLAISEKWPVAKKAYYEFSSTSRLGMVQFVQVQEGISVCNMIAQDGFYDGIRPAVSYTHLDRCLRKLNRYAASQNTSVHMPMIGAGLGGGNWDVVRAIIKANMKVDTYIYEYTP